MSSMTVVAAAMELTIDSDSSKGGALGALGGGGGVRGDGGVGGGGCGTAEGGGGSGGGSGKAEGGGVGGGGEETVTTFPERKAAAARAESTANTTSGTRTAK